MHRYPILGSVSFLGLGAGGRGVSVGAVWCRSGAGWWFVCRCGAVGPSGGGWVGVLAAGGRPGDDVMLSE